jgi:isoleucyl-tRNA synthetase
MNKYQTAKVCSEIKVFVDNLSTWYVRRTRDRFNEGDKDAKSTLKYVLDNFSKVIAPIMPFVSEKMYQTVFGNKESVHLSNWPKVDKKLIDEGLDSQMNLIREIVSIGLRTRDKNQIGLKWPLPKVEITSKEDIDLKNFGDIIKDELNVKEISLNKSKDISLGVILDTNITKELEAEGFAREITRKVQALRKTASLVKEDRIELAIDSQFDDYLKENLGSITSKVGCKTLVFGKFTKKFTNFEEGKIKDRKYCIGFNIV